MKKYLLILLLIFFTINLQAQKDTANMGKIQLKGVLTDASGINITIYPVPVRENNFTIRTNRNVSFIRITNIIGQDIYRKQYNNPLQLNKISLDNPKRGMYLVTIIFEDGVRVVKKIMVEETE
jgi:hypothetical protein